MLKNNSISIIIPVYNVEPYIAECVQSVMRQTYTGPLECIIVDDCGTDNSIGIAEQLIAEYKGPIHFRILHHEHNRGLSAARNTGTDAAMGDYIYYLDSDDYISDDCIEVLTQPLQEYAYDMVIGGAAYFNIPKPYNYLRRESGAILSRDAILTEFYISNTLYDMAWGKLIKRKLFDKYDLSFLEGQLHEDELWTFKVCSHIESLYVQKKILYQYRMRANSIMRLGFENFYKRVQSTYDTIDYVLAHPIRVNSDIWNMVQVYYLKSFLETTESIPKFKDQYYALCSRIDYNPLRALLLGKISFNSFRKQFFLVLPQAIGYWFPNWRKKVKHLIKQ